MGLWRNDILRFSLLQWFFFSAWSAFAAFNVFYLADQGFSNTSIGMALSAMTFFGVIGQPIMGYFCDKRGSVKGVFVVCSLLLSVGILFYPYYQTVLLVTLALGVFGFLWQPLQSIIDNWIFQTSPELGRNYGFIRAWGSAGYAVVAALFGRLIAEFGWNIMFGSHVLLSTAAVVIALGIRDIKRPATRATVSPPPMKPPLGVLLRNRQYLFLLLVSIFLFVPNRFVILFLPALIRDVGGSPIHQGTAMFVNTISEVPIMFISGLFLARWQPRPLLLVTSLFFALRIVMLLLATSPTLIIYSGLLQGVSFGVYLPTVRQFINQLAPAEVSTSAQTIATAVFMGVGGMLGSLVGGAMLDSVGVQATLWVLLLVSGGGCLLLVMSALADRLVRGQEAVSREV